MENCNGDGMKNSSLAPIVNVDVCAKPTSTARVSKIKDRVQNFLLETKVSDTYMGNYVAAVFAGFACCVYYCIQSNPPMH